MHCTCQPNLSLYFKDMVRMRGVGVLQDQYSICTHPVLLTQHECCIWHITAIFTCCLLEKSGSLWLLSETALPLALPIMKLIPHTSYETSFTWCSHTEVTNWVFSFLLGILTCLQRRMTLLCGLSTVRKGGCFRCIHIAEGILIAEPSLLSKNCRRMTEDFNLYIEWARRI